jgi:hypothetical protein
LTGDYEPSALGWAREHVEQIVRSGTTDGVTISGLPTVLMTYRGAKTGKLRKTPVMRVEHEGSYALSRPRVARHQPAVVRAMSGNGERGHRRGVVSGTATARAVANEDGAAVGDEFALSARSRAT